MSAPRAWLSANWPAKLKWIVRGQVPWLVMRSITGVMLFVGHVAFFVLMVMNVHHWGRDRLGPTLFVRRDRTYARLMTNEGEEDGE